MFPARWSPRSFRALLPSALCWRQTSRGVISRPIICPMYPTFDCQEMNLNENAPTATTPRNPYHWFVFLGIELTSRCRRAAPISHIQLDHGTKHDKPEYPKKLRPRTGHVSGCRLWMILLASARRVYFPEITVISFSHLFLLPFSAPLPFGEVPGFKVLTLMVCRTNTAPDIVHTWVVSNPLSCFPALSLTILARVELWRPTG